MWKPCFPSYAKRNLEGRAPKQNVETRHAQPSAFPNS